MTKPLRHKGYSQNVVYVVYVDAYIRVRACENFITMTKPMLITPFKKYNFPHARIQLDNIDNIDNIRGQAIVFYTFFHVVWFLFYVVYVV